MELKSTIAHVAGSLTICFNCTFMELKSGCDVLPVHQQVVLIVPLWNWNSEADDTQEAAKPF